MDVSVSTRWNKELVKKLADLKVDEVFGSLRSTNTGTAFASAVLPGVSYREAKEHVDYVHSLGMRFNYTMNTSCLGNNEYNPKGLTKILEDIDMVNDLGADIVTVAIPALIEMIKKRHPNLKVKASIVNNIGSIESARHFVELGADILTIGGSSNRDFKFLKALRKSTDVKLEVLANVGCLYECPYRQYHFNVGAHSSQCHDPNEEKFTDYCVMKCMREHTTNPARVIKANWIRPEDVKIYEDIGIDILKIGARHLASEWIYKCAQAYVNRKYEGNLADIICPVAMNIPQDEIEKVESWTDEEWARLNYVMNFPIPQINIDNTKLDGFINHFMNENQDCRSMCGVTCNYCEKIAEKVIEVDKVSDTYKNYIDLLQEGIDQVVTGSLVQDDAIQLEGLKWDKATLEKYEDIIKIVPWMFRGVARKKTSAKAEQFAKSRGSGIVRDEDMAQAVYSETPKNSMKDMYKKLEKHGLLHMIENK
ncbi:collagenase-like PrtC family protease [Ruminiclostridium sufflavum DSM 19573]|uniref:Collagenase-like PrtC family protease n=1 Tax=Ruminiclostridium sufflavum DSM 19573 TaxID=1121337 RepID=A0A318XQC5_9FIRM|nr:U32 family peptidase [Ruminiclostridium sufflavum]PYG88019.1 collagenase-like PrtC family protease [Ruminiclostridium sufflavum DSM 19573]